MNVEKRGGIQIVRLEGDITFESYQEHRDSLVKALESGEGKMLVDLAEVRRINSPGWGLLLALRRRAVETGAEVKLLNLPDYLMMDFLALRFERVFELFDNELLAIRSFRNPFPAENLQ